jgi:hypothetical protein
MRCSRRGALGGDARTGDDRGTPPWMRCRTSPGDRAFYEWLRGPVSAGPTREAPCGVRCARRSLPSSSAPTPSCRAAAAPGGTVVRPRVPEGWRAVEPLLHRPVPVVAERAAPACADCRRCASSAAMICACIAGRVLPRSPSLVMGCASTAAPVGAVASSKARCSRRRAVAPTWGPSPSLRELLWRRPWSDPGCSDGSALDSYNPRSSIRR